MIRIIYGPKGCGKTKKIIANANEALEVCGGSIVFITDTSEYSKDVKTAIRFINVKDYGAKYSDNTLVGFARGIIASNSDIKRLYIDGIGRITGLFAEETDELLVELDALSQAHSFDIVITLSCAKLPSFCKKYKEIKI